jgi:hypothetical protein
VGGLLKKQKIIKTNSYILQRHYIVIVFCMGLENALNQVSKEFLDKKITWAVFGGLGTFLYGGLRQPKDIDAVVLRSDFEKLNLILKEHGAEILHKTNYSIFRSMFSSFKMDNITVDVCTESEVAIGEKKYNYPIDEVLFSNIRRKVYFGIEVPVASPEDIILYKALSQRGIEYGKHDVEDIAELLQAQKIDFTYLKKRAEQSNAEDRVMSLIKSLSRK